MNKLNKLSKFSTHHLLIWPLLIFIIPLSFALLFEFWSQGSHIDKLKSHFEDFTEGTEQGLVKIDHLY